MIFKNNLLTDLPIKSVIPNIKKTLISSPNAVLIAPPGAGKTTLIPLSLLYEPWLSGKKIIMLEPRRLAARAAAFRMSDLIGERVGQTVGYRTRMDSRTSSKTRIEVVTEGILTRLIQNDSSLEDVGLLIFDEFHERSLHADLGLALSLESQSVLRDDLRILIMSATLAGETVSNLLGDAPIISSEGRSFPVETRYFEVGNQTTASQWWKKIDDIISAIKNVAQTEEGDMLVFLPGVGEIKRVASKLNDFAPASNLDIFSLYGDLPKEAQERAILPSSKKSRKIVLATSIAETSLTIEGIKIVIDSGLMRVSKFSPGRGMSRLETVAVTKASADQRRGRAGRLESGICYRLWTKGDDKTLKEQNVPEIMEADLSSLLLELALWGVTEASQLKWLDCPPKAAICHAKELLTQLEALDGAGKITKLGRKMTELPLHPRLAHMVLKGKSLGFASLACDVAAILSERDFLRRDDGFNDSDIRLRAEILTSRGERATSTGMSIDSSALKRCRQVATQLKKRLNISSSSGDADNVGLLVAFAYPDRIAKKREGREGHYLMSNGGGCKFPHAEILSKEEYLVVANLHGAVKDGKIFLSAPLMLAEIEENFAHLIENKEGIVWDQSKMAVIAQKEIFFQNIRLKEEPLSSPPKDKIAEALLTGVRQNGINCLPWDKKTRAFQGRVNFLHKQYSDFPDLSDESLLDRLEDWLLPWLDGISRLDNLRKLNLKEILLSLLTWDEQQKVETLAPTHVTVPSGSRIPINYENSDKPFLAVRLQEMFGLHETPTIAKGRVALTLHLLSPANRPMQVTEDLAGFWKTTYFDVKKDLKGRYPKHYWPDDPLKAEATNRAKRRKG